MDGYGRGEAVALQSVTHGGAGTAHAVHHAVYRGAGGVVRVISGYNIYGTDVFVREEDLETAQELLTPVDEIPEDGEEAVEQGEEEA